MPSAGPIAHSEAHPRPRSDEDYIIDLCDEALGQRAIRQHRFSFLVGDAGRGGRRVRLPVDAFYELHQLVIEYREVQHFEPTGHFDKPGRLTVSGVHRGQQRRMYDQRRREVLPQHGIRLVEFDYAMFRRRVKRLVRDRGADLSIVQSRLEEFRAG